MDISTDQSTGTKFGDLKKEERYKRLERGLRLEFIKHMEKIKADINKECTSPTWPSLSSINQDNLDSTGAIGPYLQVSRVESEVIASSSNLQKVFPVPKCSERLPMATSSVKNFPLKDYDKDRAIMPPPSTSKFVFNGANRLSIRNSKENEQIKTHSDSSMKISSAVSCSFYQEKSSNTSQNLAHSRSFTRWRVLLNDQNQLIIKGTLECGKIARSKPIIHKLSSTTVQSVYKHIYILIGPLVDERDELPDYIREKFHNGFPDDWENIYQLWTSYVAEGCKETFRWPTPITDSDDDLYSEITDFSYLRNKKIENRELQSRMVNNGSSLGYHSRTQSDGNLHLEKSKENQINSLSYNKHQLDDKNIEDSGHSSGIRDPNVCGNELVVKNVAPDPHNTSGYFSYYNLGNASFLSQMIKEEKLRIIMSNLGDKNCPPQYLDKLIELSDCLRFLMSYTPDVCTTDCKKQDSSDSKSQIQVCEKCNHSTISLVETSQEDITAKSKNKNECAKNGCPHENVQKLTEQSERTPPDTFSRPADSHIEAGLASRQDSSDSDSCMGVPHIPVNHLEKSKSPMIRKHKRRHGLYRNRPAKIVKNNIQGETQSVPDSNAKALDHDDSSVSITEDEFEKRRQEMSNHNYKEPFTKPNEESNEMNRAPSYNEKEYANTLNYPSSKPTGSNKKIENLIVKPKPIIKSCEQTNYKLISLQNISKPNILPSDITILSEDVSFHKGHLNSKNENQKENMDAKQEKLQKDILKQHPFLSYDSEDYFNENELNLQMQLPLSMSNGKTKNKKTSPSDENKENSEKIATKPEPLKKLQTNTNKPLGPKKSSTNISNETETYGSKNNPKLLTSWIPCVEYNKTNKLCLKFEGRLLNERGHVLQKKFITDPILRRHTAKLIETEKNEYFTLDGELSGTKHVFPKELLKFCATGCPQKIQEFCETWEKLSQKFIKEKNELPKPSNPLDTSIDCVNVPTSSRGRKIIPPLSYWNGERLVNKDGGVLYDQGKMEENLLSKLENVKKEPLSDQRLKRSKSNKNVNLKGSMSSKPSKTKGSSLDAEEISPRKKRLVQKLTYSSAAESSDAGEEPRKFRNQLGGIQPCPVIKMGPKPTKQNARKRTQGDHENNRKKTKTNQPQSRTRSSRVDYEWSYEKDQTHPDLLSDDQISVIK